MLNPIAFSVLSFLIIFGAVMMMTTRNILHATYWLLEVAIVSAGIVWFLGAEYLAVVQLIIYGGAVSIMTVFTLMVTLRTRHELHRPEETSTGAWLIAFALLALITYAVVASPSLVRVGDPDSFMTLQDLGLAMFSMEGWVLPFELVSLVLTVALVASIWWTKQTSPQRLNEETRPPHHIDVPSKHPDEVVISHLDTPHPHERDGE